LVPGSTDGGGTAETRMYQDLPKLMTTMAMANDRFSALNTLLSTQSPVNVFGSWARGVTGNPPFKGSCS